MSHKDMKPEYKYIYFTSMSPINWLCNAPDGTDLGEIYYDPSCKCYVYNQPSDVVITVTGLEEIIDFIKQL